MNRDGKPEMVETARCRAGHPTVDNRIGTMLEGHLDIL